MRDDINEIVRKIDEQIDKIKASKMSNTQMYKQAGNGIVVNVLEEIFKKLLKTDTNS